MLKGIERGGVGREGGDGIWVRFWRMGKILLDGIDFVEGGVDGVLIRE